MMNASNLDKVTTLIQDLAVATSNLKEFDEIPDDAEPFMFQTGWKNPEVNVPSYRETKYFSVRMDPAFDGPSLMQDIKDQLRELLTTRVDRLEHALRELGVEPTA